MAGQPENEPENAPAGASTGGYTIDELAAQTGVPSRTIRFYQAKGALAPPVRRGRIAYYDESHAERLRLVAHMQDRGLSLRAIRDLFQRTEGGDVSVSEWLGVGEQLRAPWTDDRPRVCTEEELEQLLGPPMRPGLVADLARLNLIRRETATSPVTYFIPSPGMLQIALGLERAGVPMEEAKIAHEILRKQLSRAADDLVQYFVRRAQDAEGPEQVTRSLLALRSAGVDAVRLVFAQEVERSLREAIEEGRALPPSHRKKRR
ncbi:MAG TPA: MerR family transcriptional regulator [Polyangiaceae bacterium]|jgi:DNA-binding transcriptional MerR regulator|nr:MerR family transcriptional regulator [Polyangiaceae bacterium]